MTASDQMICPVCYTPVEGELVPYAATRLQDIRVRAYRCKCDRHAGTSSGMQLEVIQFQRKGRWHIHCWRVLMDAKAGVWDYITELPPGCKVTTDLKIRLEGPPQLAEVTAAAEGVKSSIDRLLAAMKRLVEAARQ